ncbi:MAG: hypothetical protein ACRDNL_28180 [Spirillospora sp.]
MRRQPFVLRMAGFPIAWLSELAHTETAASAGAVVVKERELRAGIEALEARLRELSAELPVSRVLRAVRAGRGKIATDGEVQRLAAVIETGRAEHRRLTEQFESRYDTGLTSARLAVCTRFVESEPLRDMLFGLNPGACLRIENWLDQISLDPSAWRAKDRLQADTLALYMQRACAKNDSTGHAGPFSVGRFDPEASGLHWTESPLRHHAFLARWVADAILRWYSTTHDIATIAAPRRSPGVELTENEVDHLPADYTQIDELDRVIGPRTRHTDLPPVDLQALSLCDGAHTIEQIDAALPGTDARASLDRLADLGLIVRDLELPYGVDDPMPPLESLAAGSASVPLAELVSECARTVAVQATADRPGRRNALAGLDALFVRTTGESSTRDKGGFYQDRTLIYEETTGRFDSLVIGGELTGRVRRALPLITEVFLFLPRLRHRMEADLLTEWFTSRFPGGTASVNDYLRAFADDAQRLRPAFEDVDRTLDTWHDRLRTAAGAGAFADDSHNAPATLAEFLAANAIHLPAVCDVDLMFAAAPDASTLTQPTRLVISEVHSDEELLTHGMFAPFVAEHHPTVTDEVLAAYRELLDDGETLMNATLRHANKTFNRQALDCPEIEACDRSPLPPHLRRHLADLLVERGPAGLRLVDRATDRTVRLVAVPLSWLRLERNPLEIFGFPKRPNGTLFEVRPGEHLREVAVDDLVLSRRTWSVGAGEIGARDARGAFLAVQRLRERIDLPRHVFARTAQEGKPIYIDLDSPLLVRQLTRFAARAQDVRFSEMAPGPDELWARTGGHSYTSELRFAAFDAQR